MTGLRVLLLTAIALLVAPAVSAATPLLAITSTNQLLAFDSAAPQTITVKTIFGLSTTSESIVGIERRPATGQIYLATSPTGPATGQSPRLYVVNPDTGQATLAGTTAAPVPAFGDVATGMDFNPGVDRLRVVNANDGNFRLNPNNGALAGSDTDINPGAADLVGLAYDNLAAPTDLSASAYALDRATSTLVRIGGPGGVLPSPNSGSLTTIGPLGFTLDGSLDAGFDISPSGVGFVAAVTGGTTNLFTINLASGAMTFVGPIGTGAGELVGLTALPDVPAPIAPVSGPAGATGPAGAPGPERLVNRLVTLLADDRLSGRAGKTLTVMVISTTAATVSLDVRKGAKSVRKVAAIVKAGRNRIKITKLPAAGTYTLRLTATAGAQSTRDSARLTLKR
ncbi:MAG TPA: DUF4394 domain-containing protein [Baekduia sp.]|nr:DUF4394 domain-containing protein [Baekduia sp.]